MTENQANRAEKYQEVLKEFWGYSSFRTLQEEIIRSVDDGSDTLALLPTGGGKSLTFQVPALLNPGICIVVTPLIALMKDQVTRLRERGIQATALHSGLSRSEIGVALDNCVFGETKFLYLSPERLSTAIFKARVQQMNVNLIAVDEAHCISQWGYDFRPSYLKVSELRTLLPGVPLLALTATATPDVSKDIMHRLAFREEKLLKSSFKRENLTYLVRRTSDKPRELIRMVSRLKEGSGIVYVRSRRRSRELADLLMESGISADNYHAGLKMDNRIRRQEDWQSGKLRVIVATNAFGMGIDKANVRFVIHMDLPDSPEAYFQEAGRGGRDGEPAWAIQLFSEADEPLIRKRIAIQFPEFDYLRKVYTALFNFLQIPIGSGKGERHDFQFGEFLSKYKFNALSASSALDILSREGYFEITDALHQPSRIHFVAQREQLYRIRKNQKRTDTLVQFLLRAYSGLFTQYVNIDEGWISAQTGLGNDEVYQLLKSLSASGMIRYIPRRKVPVVTLFEERLEESNVKISVEQYKLRKKQYIKRVETMLDYVMQEHACRSRFLLHYFGEKDSERCGSCDVCRKSEREVPGEEMLSRMLRMLQDAPLTLKELKQGFQEEEQKVPGALDQLMDRRLVKRERDLKFSLTSAGLTWNRSNPQ